MKNAFIFSGIFILVFIITSCQTVDPVLVETIALDLGSDVEINTSVKIPEVELFISAPLKEEQESKSIELTEMTIPFEEVPFEVTETVPVEELYAEPDIITVPEPVYTDVVVEEEPEVSEPEEDINIGKDDSREVLLKDIVEVELETDTEEIYVESSKDITIILDKEGWIYDGEYPSSIVELKSREFSGNKTIFIFSIIDDGKYTLNFRLQDLSSGLEESTTYKVVVENPANISDQPVVINPEDVVSELHDSQTEASDLEEAVIEENIPDIISSFNQNTTEDDPLDSQLAFDAFNLLEQQGGYSQYLVNLAEDNYKFFPYDNISAEMLYKAALAIEQPGPLQDIEKALSLFKLVRDNFPISIFCDKSEERIRYLERHFMKIY